MATGSEAIGQKYAKHNAKMKIAASERRAAGLKKTAAKRRSPRRAV